MKDIDDEMDLVERLRQFSKRERTKIEVYFDQAPPGQARKRSFGFVAAFFVSRDQTADTAIKNRLAELGSEAKNWIVVTSDHEVHRAANIHRARVRRAEDFAGQLGGKTASERGLRDPKWDPSLSDKEVEYWRRRFMDNEG